MKVGMKRILTLLLAVLLVIPQVPLRTYGAEENPAEAGQSVTVTFAVGEEAYTNDPGSGQTHITVDEPITGGELVYTDWAGRYKVTGTGTVCSYTIPAGTTLAQGGFSLPKLTVANIGTENAATYISSYSWVTDQGMVCNANTVFNQDTTLSLSLYTDSDNHSLNFVCGGGSCSGNHSIPYVLGGYPSATFSLGQSVSAPYIPTKEDIDANYSSQWCTHGKDYGETFVKWQLKNTTTGEMVDFVAGLPITEEYVDADGIKVYAVWQSAPYIATFQNGEEVVEEREINRGDPLGTLPVVTPPEGYTFVGWEYTDGEGQIVLAGEDTVITQDTVFTPRFVETKTVTLTFHDVAPDGTETLLTRDVQAGMSLSQAMGDAVWSDGKPLSQCVWYDGNKEPVSLEEAPTDSLELYTYTYRLQLALAPENAVATMSAVSVVESGDGTRTLTLTVREGETLTPSDLVVDGVDYSLYTWHTADGTAVTLGSLIETGIEENITLYAPLAEEPSAVVDFYVSVNDEWVLWKSQNMTFYNNIKNNGRHNLSAAQLESVYGSLGFRASQLVAESKLFPHSGRGEDTIWANAPAVEVDGVVYSPGLATSGSQATGYDVYYLPNQNCNYSGEKGVYAQRESFYTLTVTDSGNKVYENGEDIPPVTYWLRGTTASVTVKLPDGVRWECLGRDNATVTGTDNDDGTMTFSVPNITQPYQITPQLSNGEIYITYDVNLPYPASDPDYGSPLVEGSPEHTLVGKQGTNHLVLAPSLTTYYYNSGRYLGEATFLGWAVNGNPNDLIQPGKTYTIPQDSAGVTLEARWSTKVGGVSQTTDSSMVNFFVALTAVPEGAVGWAASTEINFFTDSVYTADCHVLGAEVISQELYQSTITLEHGGEQYVVLGATNNANLLNTHNELVKKLTAGMTREGRDGRKYTFQMNFPTDEEVLRQIRHMVESDTTITVNGKAVTAAELTADRFAVRWHVFKVDTSDGWHVDGVLVAKTGSLTVTKTFAGDREAIEAIKDDYRIEVAYVPRAGEAASVVPPHPGATLALTDDNVSFNQETNTYTWTVPVDMNRDYTVKEIKYTSELDSVVTTAQYYVSGSRIPEQNTNGWQPYNTAVTVTGQTETDGRQTVAFLNTYTQTGEMILEKVDAMTGALMPGVSFKVAKRGDPTLTIYRLPDGTYTTDSAAEGAVPVEGNVITTNANGQAFLHLGVGTFTFLEVVPTGYEDPGLITVTLGADGSISDANADNDSARREFVRFNGITLRVRNYSKMVPLRVEKIWADGENTSVQVQVYANGVSMGADFLANLSTTSGWIREFGLAVPLYINGQRAVYTLLETQIGTWSYSSEYGGDGYRYYDVTYSPMQYLDANGQEVTDPQEAESIYLSVTNQRTQLNVTVNKLDQDGAPLPGAEFYLYPTGGKQNANVIQDDNGNNVLEGYSNPMIATSDENGIVSFRNLPAGTYFLVEHQAPPYYQGDDSLYCLLVQGTGVVMYKYEGDQWTALDHRNITNTKRAEEVIIEKLVAGNMGDKTKDFAFTVKSTEPMLEGTGYTLSEGGLQADFQLSHGESVTLYAPKGAVLTISETNAGDYSIEMKAGETPLSGGSYTVTDADDQTITVTNTKNVDVDMGIIQDSLPYVLLLSTAGCGSLLLAGGRKRRKKQ